MEVVLVDEENEIRKSEALVKSRYKLNPLGLKLISTLISSVQANDVKDQEYCISAKNFASVSELKGRSYYDNLKMACVDIMSKPIVIGKKGTKDYLVCNWVSSCEYRDDENVIVFQISPKLFPHILNVKSRYLKYDLSNILLLKSDYSIRLYEWLKDEYNKYKRYNRTAEVVYTIEHLRDRFEIPKSYQWQHIKDRILNKAQNDLLENCDIKFDWEVAVKIGKSVHSIKFKIYPNAKNIKENNKLPTYLSGYMPYVNYLRDRYKANGKYFLLSNFEINKNKQVYYFAINNDNLVYAMPSSGGNSIPLSTTQAEVILNASYLCATHSELYRELMSDTTDFWEFSKDDEHKEFFTITQQSINAVLKEFNPRIKPMF